MLFQWSRLEAGSIRLVRFLPYSTQNNLYLALEHRSKYWDESVHYTALSYVHGDHSDRKPITLAGRSFMITANLHAALAALHANGESDQWFWIDQLCISHQNVAEKNAQVSQMGSIYASADRVVAWLGPEAGRQLEKMLSTFENHDRNTKRSSSPAAYAMLDSTYWRRAWTKVEATRARKLQLMSSDHVMTHDFLQDIRNSEEGEDVVSIGLLRQFLNSEKVPGDDSESSASILNKILRDYLNGGSSNVLDRIFAMLNDLRLDNLPSEHRPRVDYGLSPQELASALNTWHDELWNLESAKTKDGFSHTQKEFRANVAAALNIPEEPH